eukprot:UC1_evm2s2006
MPTRCQGAPAGALEVRWAIQLAHPPLASTPVYSVQCFTVVDELAAHPQLTVATACQRPSRGSNTLEIPHAETLVASRNGYCQAEASRLEWAR